MTIYKKTRISDGNVTYHDGVPNLNEFNEEFEAITLDTGEQIAKALNDLQSSAFSSGMGYTAMAERLDSERQSHRNFKDEVTTYVKEAIASGYGLDLDELKEMAKELDLEIYDELEVTIELSVTVTATIKTINDEFDQDELAVHVDAIDGELILEYQGGSDNIALDNVSFDVDRIRV